MKRPILVYALMTVFALLPLAGCKESDSTDRDVREAMKESLVFL